MSPLVSVLLPVYNVEAYLPQCLDSVLSQSYRHLQVVLIDDGSTDHSWDVCCSYAQKDNRVETYHQKNQGVAETRNHLIDKIKGDYFLFVDSDDWIESDMVESLLSYVERDDVDLVNCGSVINETVCDKNSTTIDVWPQERAIHAFLRHKEFRGSLCNKLVKSSLLHNVRFHCGISLGEDALFCWHILQHTKSIAITNQQFYHYRMVDNSLTHANFGPKKMSAYIVWDTISSEALKWWPKYADVARARFCIEMIILLRSAAQSQHPYDESVRKLQKVIKEYMHLIRKTKLSSWMMTLYGWVGVKSYPTLKLIERWNS